jgi:hypothetical protein
VAFKVKHRYPYSSWSVLSIRLFILVSEHKLRDFGYEHLRFKFCIYSSIYYVWFMAIFMWIAHGMKTYKVLNMVKKKQLCFPDSPDLLPQRQLVSHIKFLVFIIVTFSNQNRKRKKWWPSFNVCFANISLWLHHIPL